MSGWLSLRELKAGARGSFEPDSAIRVAIEAQTDDVSPQEFAALTRTILPLLRLRSSDGHSPHGSAAARRSARRQQEEVDYGDCTCP